jgi:hypothetical protein
LDCRHQYAIESQHQPVPISCQGPQPLLKLIELARELGRPIVEIAVISCYDSAYDGFWLHHLLDAHGVRDHVLDPASLLVNRRAKRAKTDGIVERMQRALGRYLRRPTLTAKSDLDLAHGSPEANQDVVNVSRKFSAKHRHRTGSQIDETSSQ